MCKKWVRMTLIYFFCLFATFVAQRKLMFSTDISHTKSKAHAHCNSRKHTSSSQLAKSVLLVGKRKRPHCHTATQSTYVLGRQPSYTRHLWNHAAGPQNLPQSKQRCLPHAKDSVGVWRSSIRWDPKAIHCQRHTESYLLGNSDAVAKANNINTAVVERTAATRLCDSATEGVPSTVKTSVRHSWACDFLIIASHNGSTQETPSCPLNPSFDFCCSWIEVAAPCINGCLHEKGQTCALRALQVTPCSKNNILHCFAVLEWAGQQILLQRLSRARFLRLRFFVLLEPCTALVPDATEPSAYSTYMPSAVTASKSLGILTSN